MNDEQLTQRMRAAAEALQMSDSSQARHLEAISAVLASSDTPSEAPVIPLATAGATRRRRIVASVVAAAVMAPAGLAAASERSVPGDVLYPVKQMSERVLVLFDSDVIAEHRIEEIEALEAVGRFDAELYDVARAALTELGEDHPLWQRLAAAAPPNDGDGDADPAISDDDRSQDDSMGVVVTEITLPGGAEATVTLADGRLVNIDAPKGWTVTEIDDDDATLEHDDYIVEVEVSPDGSVELDVTERDDRDSDDDEAGATVTTDASDDDESSDSETTSTTEAGQRADDSDSAEPASNDDDRRDDDPSESP